MTALTLYHCKAQTLIGGGRMTSNRKACIFCGSTTNKISKEHVFRNALRKYAPSDLGMMFENFTTGERRELKDSLFDQTLRKVCKPCNEGWMERLEVQVEPVLAALIMGEPTSLTQHEARALARWAAKTNVVRGHTGRSLAVQPSAAAEIRDCEVLPSDWHVLIWRYAEATTTDLLRHFDTDIYTVEAHGGNPDTVHHGKAWSQEHILVLGQVIIYSRFSRQPEHFIDHLEDSWAEAFEMTCLQQCVLPEIGETVSSAELPMLKVGGELWKLASILHAPLSFRQVSAGTAGTFIRDSDNPVAPCVVTDLRGP